MTPTQTENPLRRAEEKKWVGDIVGLLSRFNTTSCFSDT
jgi:hypothetical protein